VATPIAALAACSWASAARMSGQRESVELEVRRRPLGRRLAGDHRQRVARHAELLLQRRQQRAIAGQLALGAQDIGARHQAGLERDPHELQVVLVGGDDVLRGLDLGERRGDRQRLADSLRRERQVRGAELVALRLGQCGLLLDRSAVAAEEIRRVAHQRAHAEHVRDETAADARAAPCRRGRASGERDFVLAAAGQARVDLRQVAGACGDHQLLGLRERGLGGGERGAPGQREGQRLGEGRRLERLPPLLGDGGAVGEALRRIAATRRRQRHRPVLVAAHRGRGRAHEVGADGAAGRQGGDERQREPATAAWGQRDLTRSAAPRSDRDGRLSAPGNSRRRSRRRPRTRTRRGSPPARAVWATPRRAR